MSDKNSEINLSNHSLFDFKYPEKILSNIKLKILNLIKNISKWAQALRPYDIC
jgi:hypothetical protein